MEKNINSTVPSFGLFDYCWLFHPIKFFKKFFSYSLRLKTFKKKGYSEVAEWETFNWLIKINMRRMVSNERY